MFIPVPVLGALVSNAVGTMIYQIGKDSFCVKEKELIESYLQELADLDLKLAEEYRKYIEQLNRCYVDYMELLTGAFNPDVQGALEGSVELAKCMGVSDEEILDNYDKIAGYFLD